MAPAAIDMESVTLGDVDVVRFLGIIELHGIEVFFFQAEDGIRDWSVTGVQTCALPISRDPQGDRQKLEQAGVDFLFAPPVEEIYPAGFRTSVNVEGLADRLEGKIRPGHFRGVATVVLRSEERRVGKECRCRWSRYSKTK